MIFKKFLLSFLLYLLIIISFCSAKPSEVVNQQEKEYNININALKDFILKSTKRLNSNELDNLYHYQNFFNFGFYLIKDRINFLKEIDVLLEKNSIIIIFFKVIIILKIDYQYFNFLICLQELKNTNS